jgi:hypothetical protein
MVSALPLLRITSHKADPAPTHAGNSNIAMTILAHLGMADYWVRELRESTKQMARIAATAAFRNTSIGGRRLNLRTFA